jgi:hypothetical protein
MKMHDVQHTVISNTKNEIENFREFKENDSKRRFSSSLNFEIKKITSDYWKPVSDYRNKDMSFLKMSAFCG